MAAESGRVLKLVNKSQHLSAAVKPAVTGVPIKVTISSTAVPGRVPKPSSSSGASDATTTKPKASIEKEPLPSTNLTEPTR